MKFQIILSTLVALSEAAGVILTPTSQTGKPLAMVFTPGALAAPELYKPLMEEFQAQASEQGFDAWIAISQYFENMPNPVQIEKDFHESLDELKKNGFTGDRVLIAGHSLGTVIS